MRWKSARSTFEPVDSTRNLPSHGPADSRKRGHLNGRARGAHDQHRSSSPGRLLWWRLVSVGECLQEGYDLVFLFIGQPQVSNRRVPVLRNLRIGPARHLLSLSAILTTREFV